MKIHHYTIFPAEGRLNKCHARPSSRPATVDRTELYRFILDCIGVIVALVFMIFMFAIISDIPEPAPASEFSQQEVQHGNYTHADPTCL